MTHDPFCSYGQRYTPGFPAYCDCATPVEDVSFPVSLTVITPHGEATVTGVREDSIEMRDGRLIAEGADKSNTRLFTFVDVIGWSTTI